MGSRGESLGEEINKEELQLGVTNGKRTHRKNVNTRRRWVGFESGPGTKKIRST